MSRLSEILGVEEGREFTFDKNGLRSIKYKIENGKRMYLNNGKWEVGANEDILVEMIAHPEKIILQKPKLTEQQITVIKGRIAEGWNWVATDLNNLWVMCFTEKPINSDYTFYSSNGKAHSLVNEDIFDFVTYKDSPIYLPDLLKEVEE